MSQVMVVAALVVALSVNGCAFHQQTAQVPSEDADQLVAAIGQKGQDERYVSAGPLGSYQFDDWLQVGAVVTEGTLAIALLCGLAAAAVLGRFNGPIPSIPAAPDWSSWR